MASKAYVALTVVGVLVLLAGIVFVVLDYTGNGDTSGLDPKDLGILLVGLVLAIVGAVMSTRKRP